MREPLFTGRDPVPMTNLRSLRSSRPALVDRLREEEASALLQVAGVVGFALLTALAAQVNVRLYLWEVPITLQTMAVYASGLYLGWRNGLLAQALYLLMGMVAPVYAGSGYGPDYLLGAVSAGYLLSYPVAAAAIGALSKRWKSLSGGTPSRAARCRCSRARRSSSRAASRGCTSLPGTRRGWSRSTRACCGSS